ncbi:MAG TPA: C39 family peptidase [Ktedonobacteraceae bacterium]|nr:C39 family peptidase [Ktedonobacteraceae bacterium]
MRKLGCSLLFLVVLLIVLSPSLMTTASDGARVHQLVRISQLDPKQYRSTAEYQTWAASTCSTAAMTEVMNYYGRSYRITDVLKAESSIGAISPQLGLLQEEGIAPTVAHFGFQANAGHQLTLDQMIELANHGTPVIVSFPPQRYPHGHLLVVTGGTQNTVFVADSSVWNTHSFTRSRFLQYWGGFAAVARPQEGGQS